jgi:tRNA(Ile)-lysidine synthase TilS/MesJ
MSEKELETTATEPKKKRGADTKRLLSFARRAVDDYGMIEEGDKIAVGVSGGKDSLALLAAMAGLRRFYPKSFSVIAVSIDMGLKGMDFSPVTEYCRELGVEHKIIKTEISKVIFDIRKESNPCSLCAKMRRGALNSAAAELGCNKVALGHHFDDVVETFMLNLFFEGRIGVFQPVTYLSRVGVTVIRPLIYMPEKDIRYFAGKSELPVVTSTCPADGNTERQEMKQLLARLERENRGLRYRIYGAIQRAEVGGFREISKMAGIKEYEE